MFNATVQCTSITHGGKIISQKTIWHETPSAFCISYHRQHVKEHQMLQKWMVHNHSAQNQTATMLPLKSAAATSRKCGTPFLIYQTLADMPDRSTESRQNSTSFALPLVTTEQEEPQTTNTQPPHQTPWSLPLSLPFLISLLTPWIMLVQTAGRPTADAWRRFDFQVNSSREIFSDFVRQCICATCWIVNLIMCGAVCLCVTDIYCCKVRGLIVDSYLPSVCALSSQWVKCVKKKCNLGVLLFWGKYQTFVKIPSSWACMQVHIASIFFVHSCCFLFSVIFPHCFVNIQK